MSRLKANDAVKLEALEGASALLHEMADTCGITGTRLAQARARLSRAQRRVPGLSAELSQDVLAPVHGELADVQRKCEQAHRLVKDVLAIEQAQRLGENCDKGCSA